MHWHVCGERWLTMMVTADPAKRPTVARGLQTFLPKPSLD